MNKILKLEDFKANTKEWFLEQLGNMPASQALQTISDLYDELHKPQYPTTYNDCCNILGFKNRNKTVQQFLNSCDLYDFELMTKISMLKVCRDAYWKIAGEEMGLDKPWEPNWNEETDKFTISNKCNKIYLNNTVWYSEILAFPTAEMRDAFYENFKDLIEQCKELL